MSRFLETLFGRLPIGWFQLSHSRARLIAAVTGIIFANLLVLIQLGVVAAMNGIVASSYSLIDADIIISPASANALFNGTTLPRRLNYLALSDPDIAAASPLYLSSLEWTLSDGSAKTLVVYGFPMEAQQFAGPAIAGEFARLTLPGQILLDSAFAEDETSPFFGLSSANPKTFEIEGRSVTAAGTLKLGGGFGFDGGMVASDQTYLNVLAAKATSATPSQILLNVMAGADPAIVAARLNERFAKENVKARTMAQAVADDTAYMNTQVPMGIIFGIGVVIGILVGLVIVYQVLSTDVSAHLKEYATFRAMGYPFTFFLSVIFEEAVIMAVLGSVPGIALGTAAYAAMASATGLPLGMSVGRAIMALLGTIAACSVSGVLAARKLRSADPAELF